jgi:TatD-related deoxyribonuclease
VTRETGVIVYPVVAPYPVDLLSQVDEVGERSARELQEAALDVAGRMVEEQRAVALGEVGRPHFEVPESVATVGEAVFRHALEVARDADCPVVIHSEDLNPGAYRALAEFAARASFPVERLVKHYARQVLPPKDLGGVVPSYVARRETVAQATAQPGPWLLETDYLDDPRRPGAVLDLTTVPRRAAALAVQGNEALDRLRIPFVETIERVYGFRPAAPVGGCR